jgi:ankyrin repeat protein
MGHKAVVELLLRADGVNPGSTSSEWTPLLHAAARRQDAVVKLLLAQDGVDTEPKFAMDCMTPLLWAARNGWDAVVKLLLADDRVNPNATILTRKT